MGSSSQARESRKLAGAGEHFTSVLLQQRRKV